MSKGSVALGIALLLAGAARAAPPRQGIVTARVAPGTLLVDRGSQLYAGNCVSCHGTAGKGTRTGPQLRGAGALAADFYLRTGYMPLRTAGDQPRRSRVLFSERELRALVAYVASLEGPAIPEPHPERGNVSDGFRLFTEHCAGCHQVLARGGYLTDAIAPPLQDATAVQIAEAVRIGPYVMPRFSRHVLSDHQLDSVIAYVQHVKHPQDRGGWAIGHLGPVPEGMVAWLLAGAVLVATCLVIGGRLRGG